MAAYNLLDLKHHILVYQENFFVSPPAALSDRAGKQSAAIHAFDETGGQRGGEKGLPLP